MRHLGVTCHLLDVPGGHLRTLRLLCKLPDLGCGKLVQVYVAVINYLGDKFFIFKEEPKDVPVKDLGCFWGYLAKATWICTALYHSSTDLFPCWKLLSKSNLALTSFNWGLQNSSNLSQMVSVDKLQETYWPMPKSPLHIITFLHCLFSGNMASSHSRMFSHLKYHFRNLWYRPSFTVQSILGPSM